MKIKGNLLIFSADNQERVDVRKLKEKKLQILLDENNELPKFEVNNQEYIKKSAEDEIEKLFEISNLYFSRWLSSYPSTFSSLIFFPLRYHSYYMNFPICLY